jgi:hypothetical protein
VTVTVTSSSDITATPPTLTFTPTVFSGTVTVKSTATPGTTGTVKFSAPGYADGVVKVTVDQSTNLVVNPDSLSIPANGAESFTVKLANVPTAPVTVTVKTSTPDLTTTPTSLTFKPADFNLDQTVLVSAGLGAVPGAQSVLLDAGPLGQFNLPVTITPISKTTFFIDPANGNDASPGTAAQPWKSVEDVLNSAKPTGSTVAAVANAGNNVVVTILGSGANLSQTSNDNINTPALSVGSVTVLQAPFPKTFTLNMGNKQLILNKGYKLQDIKITSTFNSTTATSTEPAVSITHPTAGLASVDVECTGSSNNVICVEVTGTGSHTLKDVRVDVADDSGATNPIIIGIKNNDAAANLSIVGGRVRPISNTTTDKPVTLIRSDGVLTVTGLTVDMTNAGHAQASTGILLNKAGSFITGSTIKTNRATTASTNAIGINVQAGASKSTVEGNTFIGFNLIGTNGNLIGVRGNDNLSSNALLKNTFNGFFTPQPVE